jgi:hypothetical protein
MTLAETKNPLLSSGLSSSPQLVLSRDWSSTSRIRSSRMPSNSFSIRFLRWTSLMTLSATEFHWAHIMQELRISLPCAISSAKSGVQACSNRLSRLPEMLPLSVEITVLCRSQTPISNLDMKSILPSTRDTASWDSWTHWDLQLRRTCTYSNSYGTILPSWGEIRHFSTGSRATGVNSFTILWIAMIIMSRDWLMRSLDRSAPSLQILPRWWAQNTAKELRQGILMMVT